MALFLAFCLLFAVRIESRTIDYYPSTTVPSNLRGLTLVGGDIVNFHAASPGGAATYDFGTVGSTFTWTGQQNNPIIIQAFPGDKITLLGSNPNYNTFQVCAQRLLCHF